MNEPSVSQNHTDIPNQYYIYKLLPEKLKPYIQLLRWDRPAGAVYLFIPCLWGLALANGLTLINVALFLLGTILMRSAGCIYNDIIDRKIDAQVERTKMRPLACGIISLTQAILTMTILVLLSVLILLQFNVLAIFLGVLSIGLVAIYPWMKRFTYWPQLFLGFTFNWGVLLAYATVTNHLDMPAVLIYMYGILWTLFYDTIYAHQDKDDDAIIGVKSTALRLGSKTKPILSLFILMQIAILIAVGLINSTDLVFYVLSITSAIISFIILYKVDIENPSSCLYWFKRSQIIGWTVLLALMF